MVRVAANVAISNCIPGVGGVAVFEWKVSALPLMLGYWGILFERERRGWPDRRAHTVVCYADPELDKDLV